MNRHRCTLHPFVGFLTPLIASPFVLVIGSWGLLLALLIGCLLLSVAAGWPVMRRTIIVTSVVLGFVALSFLPWLGGHHAILLGLRMATLTALIMATYSTLDWQSFADTLITHARVPYPLVDVMGMGRRFTALMKREMREMATRLRIDARGHFLRWLRSLPKVVVPMLVASFRLADLTAMAMESRGFASRRGRTTHAARRPGWFDVAALVALTGALIWAGAVLP